MTPVPTPRAPVGVPYSAGSRLVHRLLAGATHGGFAVEVPLHVVFGDRPGPMLAVHAGLSGLEIEPALTLPSWVTRLDPAHLRGTVVVAPLVNLSGFEFEQHAAAWDGSDLNGVGAGCPDGMVGERLVHTYVSSVLDQADAIVDVRTGSQWGYYRYAGVHDVGPTDRISASLEFAASMGLPHAAVGEPIGRTLAGAMADRGRRVVTLWLGGGPGLRDHRERDAAELVRALDGALRHLGMLDGDGPAGVPSTKVRIHTVLRPDEERGLTFMHARLRGERVAAGAELGLVRHPFEGHVVRRVLAPRAGVVLHAGASWPVVPEGSTLAILADPL